MSDCLVTFGKDMRIFFGFRKPIVRLGSEESGNKSNFSEVFASRPRTRSVDSNPNTSPTQPGIGRVDLRQVFHARVLI
jgi:hypothetical protein